MEVIFPPFNSIFINTLNQFSESRTIYSIVGLCWHHWKFDVRGRLDECLGIGTSIVLERVASSSIQVT